MNKKKTKSSREKAKASFNNMVVAGMTFAALIIFLLLDRDTELGLDRLSYEQK
jgi:hypothetical protein